MKVVSLRNTCRFVDAKQQQQHAINLAFPSHIPFDLGHSFRVPVSLFPSYSKMSHHLEISKLQFGFTLGDFRFETPQTYSNGLAPHKFTKLITGFFFHKHSVQHERDENPYCVVLMQGAVTT